MPNDVQQNWQFYDKQSFGMALLKVVCRDEYKSCKTEKDLETYTRAPVALCCIAKQLIICLVFFLIYLFIIKFYASHSGQGSSN